MGTNASLNKQPILQVNRSILSAIKSLTSQNNNGFTIKYKSPEKVHYIRAEKESFFVVLQSIMEYAGKLAGKDEKISIAHTTMQGRRHNDKSALVKFCVRIFGRGISEEMFTTVNGELQRMNHALSNNDLSPDKFDIAFSKTYFRVVGGNVWIQSKLNKGILIYFTYPLLREVNLAEIGKPEVKVVHTPFTEKFSQNIIVE